MNTLDITTDLILIVAGFFANRKWKDNTLGPVLMTAGVLLLVFDLLLILVFRR